ncbi:klaroid protein-like [Euwallacea similis]|uniref:klaroid protein-like n=1 Tax=Euwallacea similis TaxID=1736056 RepID=UPI00344E45C1
MSNMELRSSRSRSKTPFLGEEFIEKESSSGNRVEKTVTRLMRKNTVVKINESASSSTDEVNTLRTTSTPSPKLNSVKKSFPSSKSERSLRSRVLKTSDYSSEDGENEVSSSRTIRQNQSNQLIEDAKAVGNGKEMPALELYRRSGRYWDVYPKTDWTYSPHSKDRVEIAPGVVAMPNMSRKTIHALDDSGLSYESSQNFYSENVAHKYINTEDMLMLKYVGDLSAKSRQGAGYNGHSEEYMIRRRTVTKRTSFKQIITTIVTTFFTMIFSMLRYSYRVQTGIFSQIHRIASQVMLWDTYLLWKTRPGGKATKLALLCLLPLLLLGGAWLLLGLGSSLHDTVANYTNAATSFIPSFAFWSTAQLKRTEREAIFNEQDVLTSSPDVQENVVKITKKIYLEPPSASDIAGNFSSEQLEAIAMAVKRFLDIEGKKEPEVDTERLVQSIVNNPSFVNEINNHYKAESARAEGVGVNEELLRKQQLLIDTLLREIDKMRKDIVFNNKLRGDEYARLSLDMKKCCDKRPIINIEGYVSRAVSDLLNNPEFLRSQQGLNSWLQALFVAKRDLEFHLGNITMSMDSKMAEAVESNAHIFMEKITTQFKKADATTNADEKFVKRIVKQALAIYDADRTGLVDYAMESMGGQVVSTRCTELYKYGKAVFSILGIPLWQQSNSPRSIITPTLAPGDCWAFQNFPGFVVVKLSNTVKIDAFSIEHVSRLLLPEGKMDSAPKDFEVYGLREENDKEPVLLGAYQFELDGESLQFFSVQKDNQVFDMIEIRILSNHGNPNYTCLYRFRVHGQVYHAAGR